MRKPLLRCLAPLAIVAFCAAAPAPQATIAQPYIGGLDLPVPATTGSWSVSLRSLTGPSGTCYAIDSSGSAITARFFPGAFGLGRQTPTPVTLAPQMLAAIQSTIATANAAAWIKEPNQPVAYLPIPIDMGAFEQTLQPVSAPRSHLTLTLAWRTPDGTVLHGQAAWNPAGPSGEPASALTLAHTLGSAFGLLI